MGEKHRSRERKRRERARNGRGRFDLSRATVDVIEGPPLGPNVVQASLTEVLAALQSVPANLGWKDVRDQIVPVFPRLRPQPAGAPEPLRVVVPPGVSVGFGIDVGPAFLSVSGPLLESWAVAEDELLERALANLAGRMAAVDPEEVIDAWIDRLPIRALQADAGSASAYVLLPEGLPRLFGKRPQLLMAPMRNLLLSVPAGADRELVAWIFAEFASQDPNALAPTGFVFRDGVLTIEPLGEAFGEA